VLYTAIDTGDGAAMTITIFPDEETAARSREAVKQVQRNLGDEFGVTQDEVIQGHVVVSRASEPVLQRVDPA
jgi:hypothetical protein